MLRGGSLGRAVGRWSSRQWAMQGSRVAGRAGESGALRSGAKRWTSSFNTGKGFETAKPMRVSYARLGVTAVGLAAAGLYVYQQAFFRVDIWPGVEQKYLCDDETLRRASEEAHPGMLGDAFDMINACETRSKAQLDAVLPEDRKLLLVPAETAHILQKFGGIYGSASTWEIVAAFQVLPMTSKDGKDRAGALYTTSHIYLEDPSDANSAIATLTSVRLELEDGEETQEITFGDTGAEAPHLPVNPPYVPCLHAERSMLAQHVAASAYSMKFDEF